MASIDKIYGNTAQYWEFRNWCDLHAPEIVFCFYYSPEEANQMDGEFALVNLSTWQDMWLYVHCPIFFVCDRIADQYNLSPITNIIKYARRDVRLVKAIYKQRGKACSFPAWFMEWRQANYPLCSWSSKF